MKLIAGKRVKFLSGLIVLLGLILLSRLYLLQVVSGDFFKDKADRQYVSPAENIFNRGNIYFSDKDGNLVSAATLKTGFILAISPKLLENPEDAYNKINSIHPIAGDVFAGKAALKNDPYEEIAHRLPEEIGQKISQLKIPGVIIEKERWRYYPGDSLGAHVLGFVGFKGDALSGRYGLERYYNDVLSRDEGDLYTNFFAQIFSKVKTVISERELKGEGDLVLTLEPSVEAYLQSQLKKVRDEYKAESVGGVIMNPQNGEIYAMGALPDFNPNTFNEEIDLKVFGNPLVESIHEMGSIIKPLTMAAGLDSKVIRPETTYEDKGTITLDKKTISNYDGKARGVVPMQQILSQSLNVGAAFVAQKLGNERFAEYMKNYGFGEETGIDLPGEVRGHLDNLKSNKDVEYATAAFGQGIAMTPIETVRALASLGNGGILITPHVVKEIRYNVGVSRTLSYGDGKQVLSKETSDAITGMLVSVVDKALLNGKIKMDHYSIAAKTGTAQVANPAGGGYYTDRYLHSFFGYFPAYSPQFIVFFYLYYPKGIQYASETLTVPFSETAKFLINYYNIPPDR
ncbi:MAG: penicillin-binding protein 2 [bacterium]|nr:penicillin-binding protein 2 [bacterium]